MVQNNNTYAILTINDDGNYGNQLQNYALSKILSSVSAVSTIRMFLRTESKMKHRLLTATLPLYTRKQILKSVQIATNKVRQNRIQNFKAFSRLIPSGKYRLSVGAGFEIASRGSEPSKIVIGSDQVWNYRWVSTDELKLRLGMFAPSEMLMSYSASIGLDDIDNELKPLFKEGLSRIPHISVREDRAAELVKEIAGREAAVVLDPTLMITRDQWEGVFTGFVPEGDRYVLTYFLGRPSDEQERIISSVAKGLDVRIRRINDTRDCETYAAGPAEFVELFAKAQYVFTDSYHACCFSILYNKPFKVFNRAGFDGKASMNSRMRTLYRLFELEDLMGDIEALPIYDWNRVNTLLTKHRAESRDWLESALGCCSEEAESA